MEQRDIMVHPRREEQLEKVVHQDLMGVMVFQEMAVLTYLLCWIARGDSVVHQNCQERMQQQHQDLMVSMVFQKPMKLMAHLELIVKTECLV